MVDFLSAEKRSLVMSSIKGKNTLPELVVRKLLHKAGLRYVLHCRNMPGCPDIVFKRDKIVIFIDGDFWHGWKFKKLAKRLSSKWTLKIQGNITRDRSNRKMLKKGGWKVLRFWEHQVMNNPSKIANIIIQEILNVRTQREVLTGGLK